MKNIQITRKDKNIVAVILILVLLSLLALFINNINQSITIKKKAATTFKAQCKWDPIQVGVNYKVTIIENCGGGDNNINISQPPAGSGSIEFNATAGCSYKCTVRAENPTDPNRCYLEKTANAAIAEIPLDQPTNTPIIPLPCWLDPTKEHVPVPPGYILDPPF